MLEFMTQVVPGAWFFAALLCMGLRLTIPTADIRMSLLEIFYLIILKSQNILQPLVVCYLFLWSCYRVGEQPITT